MSNLVDKKISGFTNALEWEADFNPRRVTVMSFSYAGRDLFDCDGVEIGFLKEVHGMQKHLRFHTADKTSWYSVDSKVIQPFGPEPIIGRRIEQSGNFMRVTTDVLIKSAMALEFLKIDTLRIRGEWENITVYYQSSRESFYVLSKEIDIENIDNKRVLFETIPLAVVFTDKNGIQLEIGTGYDLWRWNNAARFYAENRFVIKKEKDYIVFERTPILWENEHEIKKFNFRFSWYFAWGKKSLTERKSKKKIATLLLQANKLAAYQAEICDYKLDYSNWPTATKSSNSNEPCFASRQTENLLKDFLRKTLPKMSERDKFICLHGVLPHICSNSGHMERNKPEIFVHWNYWNMMVFWEWANNFFASNDKKFAFITDSQSLLSYLPSFRGMMLELED
jgi:hypothetical protein